MMLAEQDEERHDPQPGRDNDGRGFVGLQGRWVGTAWGAMTASWRSLNESEFRCEDFRVTRELKSGASDVCLEARGGTFGVVAADGIQKEAVFGVHDPPLARASEGHEDSPEVVCGIPESRDGGRKWLHVAARIRE